MESMEQDADWFYNGLPVAVDKLAYTTIAHSLLLFS